jgi:hypothetical protein
MPCLSPFKKYIDDLFEAYDTSGPVVSLAEFIDANAENIITGDPSAFGVYPTPEYCCPSCDATDDPCGNIYTLGFVDVFKKLAQFKGWVTNPGSVPCCYNFMGQYKTIVSLEATMCWSSIERCCNEFDTCFKTFIEILPTKAYADLMSYGIVEYGAVTDPDNICFLKTYLEDRYQGDSNKISTYLFEFLRSTIVIVCPVGGDEVWALSAEVYMKWCESIS